MFFLQWGAIPVSCVAAAVSIWMIQDNFKLQRGGDDEAAPGGSPEEKGGSKDNNTGAADIVSSRGRRALTPPFSYLGAFLEALQNPCEAKTNPEGPIALCVAENKLILEDVSARLSQNRIAFVDRYHCYNDMRGMAHVKESVARFLVKHFLKPTGAEVDREILADDVIIGSGCAGLLNSLFFSIAEKGDAVLIPSPYYAAFENDMKIVAECVPVKVPMEKPSLGPTVDDLERSFQRTTELGNTPKILLLTNPNNPLGTIYSPETMMRTIEWARGHGIHIIVDEIYGLSVHDPEKANFQSIIKILKNDLGNDVHFLWALSKDFGSSGFRFGVLYTQNKVLADAMGNLNVFSCVSQPMQAVVADLLDDDLYVDQLLHNSRQLLKASYRVVTTTLEQLDIPYVQAQAGIFVYVDFSSLLDEPTFESEAKFASLLIKGSRMILTPGFDQRDDKPGMFRICYAWVSVDVLKIAMERLTRLVKDVRKA